MIPFLLVAAFLSCISYFKSFALIRRLSDIPGIRPALLNDKSYSILVRLRSFRHFIRNGYDYDLDKDELILLQNKLNVSFDSVISDVNDFELFINKLVNESE